MDCVGEGKVDGLLSCRRSFCCVEYGCLGGGEGGEWGLGCGARGGLEDGLAPDVQDGLDEGERSGDFDGCVMAHDKRRL